MRFVVPLLAAVLLLLSACDVFSPGHDEPLGRLVFASWDTTYQRSFIYSVNTDGSDLRQLSSIADSNWVWWAGHVPRGSASGPVWSPDGTQIAYMESAGPDEEHIVLMNADGSDKRDITPPGGYSIHPQFSPSGRYLLYLAGGPLGSVLEARLVNLADFSEISVPINRDPVSFEGKVYYLSYARSQWAGDDDLLYVSAVEGEPNWNLRDNVMFMFRISSGEIVEQVVAFPPMSGLFFSSGDARKLIRQVRDPNTGHFRIVLYDIDRGSEAAVSSGPTDVHPRWGSDSRHIVFAKEQGRHHRIHVLDIYNQEERAVPGLPTNAHAPAGLFMP